ncbi:DUF308 domain-containing protein [Actinomycetospora sp. OC33-EN08]|uniref:DUF308 domain-containing protein n=1 Tax=Actinomycetospora aurantiaca TaxID=3129233 RepID=A0ABU8MX07_9PSEU
MTAADRRGLLGGPRRDGPVPKLTVVGVIWLFVGVVALITAMLMPSLSIAVFGVLCLVGGAALFFGQRARERFEQDEGLLGTDPAGVDPEPAAPADDPVDPVDPGDDRHATRVMSTGGEDDTDIIDAEYWEPSPSDQDDGTGYDDDETAYQRRRQEEFAREAREYEAGTSTGTGDADGDDSTEQFGAADDRPDRETAKTGETDETDGRDDTDDADDTRRSGSADR